MKVFAVLLLVSLQAISAPDLGPPEAEQPREIFAQAYAHYLQGNFKEAKELFSRTLNVDFLLEDYSLHYLAAIAFEEKDWGACRQALDRLKEQHPHSIWYHAAELRRAKILLAEKRHAQALQTLLGLRAEKGAKNAISEEALYLLARTHEDRGELSRAFSLYQQLRDAAPVSAWAADARREVGRLRKERPDMFGLATTEALSAEAERLARERQYDEAEALYRKSLARVDAKLRPGHLMALANVYLAVRRRSDAVPVLREIARDFPHSHEAPTAIFRLGWIFWNRNENLTALDYFRELAERYPRSAHVDFAQFASGDIHESLGKKDEAATLYQSLPKVFPASRFRDDATWRLAWLHYSAGELREARAAFQALASQRKSGPYYTAALYWQGRCAEKMAAAEDAKRLFLQILESRERSYYQGLAAARLERAGIRVEEAEEFDLSNPAGPDAELSGEISFHLTRARELAAVSLNSLAVAELDAIPRSGWFGDDMKVLLMREYARNQAFARSVALANDLVEPSSDGERYRYPLAYWDTIQRKAEERGLDPFLVVSLIRQESLFNPEARSHASALGLMQLLPSTAARIARQLGLAAPSRQKLFDPELNLTLGTQYLKDLLERYSNDQIKALAAYNAGENALARWENEIRTDDPEEFIERIPYIETRQYVKLVLRNHRIYKKLYAPPR